jgi:hypothetical protein
MKTRGKRKTQKENEKKTGSCLQGRDDDNGFGATVRYAPGVTKVHYRGLKKAEMGFLT